MCGIGGIISPSGREAEPMVRAMMASLSHRGPDDEGFFVDDSAALGHRRLSILDTSSAGHQPMFSSSRRYVLTFNGEIYNYLELREELGGTFVSGSDSEVILRAYEVWGTECVKKFNGIFAFAIWDTEERTLFCARDHVGVKPFYYHEGNGAFYFASEIKAIHAVVPDIRPNDELIYEYLAYGMYEHTNETFFQNIVQLPPSHTLTFKNGTCTVSRYWYLPDSLIDTTGWTDTRIADEFTNLLQNAVTFQLRSDVPVGMHASGGIDSSILTQTAHQLLGGQKNMRLFSFAYAGSEYDEVPHVQRLADSLGWDAQIVHLTPEDVVRLADASVFHQDQPHSGLPSLALQRLVESYKDSDIKVILEGQGGDEIMAGYEYYMGAFLLDIERQNGQAAADSELEQFTRFRSFKDGKELAVFVEGAKNAYTTPGGSADASFFSRANVLKESFSRSAHKEPRKFEAPFNTHLANMQYRDIFHTKLPRVLRSCDRASMAYGRELRVPILDHRLISFCMSLPLNQRIREGEQRFFVRNAFKGKLPEHIVRTPKRAVVNPQREWFKKELRPWIEDILASASFGERPYFDQKAVLAEYRAYCEDPHPRNSFHIWQWLNMELWLRTFFDSPTAK
jgi:asparagine synthase (glutamine-hydrolysing)